MVDWVVVRPTTLSALGPSEAQAGLFVTSKLSSDVQGCYKTSDERKIIRKGTFIGFYRGKFKPRNGSTRPYRGPRRSHTMETEDNFIVPPATSGGTARAA